jgi:hypothetical protein
MDWFEKLTGFRETSYYETRAKLKVEGRQLQSLINGKSYDIGDLELVSLQTMCERVKSSGGLPGRLKVSVVTGDVRNMHESPENTGALFRHQQNQLCRLRLDLFFRCSLSLTTAR